MTAEKRVSALEAAIAARGKARKLKCDLSDAELISEFLYYVHQPGRYDDPDDFLKDHQAIWGMLVRMHGTAAHELFGFDSPPMPEQLAAMLPGQRRCSCDKLRNLPTWSPEATARP